MPSFLHRLKTALFFFLVVLSFSPTTHAFFSFEPEETKTIPLPRINRVIGHIERYYYDPSRIQPQKMLEQGLNSLTRLIPELLVEFPEKSSKDFVVTVKGQTSRISREKVVKLSDILVPTSEALSFIKKNLPSDTKEQEEWEYAFINGMLSTLDPHSNFMPPKDFNEFKTQTEGEYGGIGIVIGLKENQLSVIAPLEGTPAAKAGILAEDRILEIDHIPTVNMALSEAVDKLRGQVNTKVLLLVGRANKEPWEVELTRQIITIQSVKSKLVTVGDKKIGVLRIRGFQEETFSEMERAIRSMQQAAPNGINGYVLDLRNNPGGLLDQSLEMADRFLKNGPILYSVGANNADEEISIAQNSGNELTQPLIVLVNQGSASAAEIVAGALKNNDRGLIIGQQTFGKGSVQTLFSLPDGSAIKLTIAQYLTPGRVSIQAVGITPDVQLIPSQVDDEEGIKLLEDEPWGEKSLDEHLENAQLVKKTKPFFKLYYWNEKNKEAETDLVAKIDEQKDYALSLALKILTQAPDENAKRMFFKAHSLLMNEGLEQDKLIASHLEKKEIDWSLKFPTPPTPKTLEFNSSFFDKKTGKPIIEMKAGDEVSWKITATNTGNETLYRLIGIVEAQNPLLNQREFIFGKIDPGAAKTAELTFKIPSSLVSISEKIAVRFESANKGEIAPLKVATQFIETAKPTLTYSYTLNDKTQGILSGNGDGMIEAGETVALDLQIFNTGTVPSKETLALLKNSEGEGVLLREGRVTLNELAPGAQTKTRLVFKVVDSFPKNFLKLDLTVMDTATASGLSDTLTLPIKSSLETKADPKPSTIQKTPLINIISKTLQEGGKSLNLTGTATDDTRVSDITIFSGGRKVYYRQVQKPSSQESFDVDLSLKPGINFIMIQARDDRKLTAQKTLTLILDDAQGNAKKSQDPASLINFYQSPTMEP